jgi:hypothetical protein
VKYVIGAHLLLELIIRVRQGEGPLWAVPAQNLKGKKMKKKMPLVPKTRVVPERPNILKVLLGRTMKRDISGLSKRTAFAVITDDVDRGIERALRQTEASLLNDGADTIEVEAEMTRQRAELALWREQSLARVAAELGLASDTVHWSMNDLSNMELALIQLALIQLRECPAGEDEQKLVNDLLTRAIVECAKRQDQSFSPFAHTIRALAEAALARTSR